MQLADLYQEIILDHYRDPRGAGTLSDPRASAHHVNPTCGDEVTVEVALDDDGGLLVRHQGVRCSISRASASVITEIVDGQAPEHAERARAAFTDLMHGATSSAAQGDVDEELLGDAMAFSGVAKYPARIKCALLPWMALQDACIQAGLAAPRQSGTDSTTTA